MKDLFAKVVAAVPAYVGDLLRLVPGPKRFVGDRVEGASTSPIGDATVFLAMSFLLGWAVKVSFIRGEPFLELAGDAAFTLFQVLAYGATLYLAWRLVKGGTDPQRLFAIHFYYSGILLLVVAVWFMVLMGILRAADPAFYAEMWEATTRGDMPRFVLQNGERFAASPAFGLTIAAILLGPLAMGGWLFAGWGAYRHLHGATRLHSVAAAVLFVVLLVPVEGVLFLIANAGAR